MKKLTIIGLLMLSQFAFAHDEGHGPKLGDQPKFGGKVAAVIDKKEIKKGTDAEMLYKAELTKNTSNVVRVYMYDKKMSPITIKEFGSAAAEHQYKDRKTRKWVSKSFKLEKKKGYYEGSLNTKPRRPFNIDVTINNKNKKLFMAFDNLN